MLSQLRFQAEQLKLQAELEKLQLMSAKKDVTDKSRALLVTPHAQVRHEQEHFIHATLCIYFAEHRHTKLQPLRPVRGTLSHHVIQLSTRSGPRHLL